MDTNTGKPFERLAHRIFHAIENHSRSDLESVDVKHDVKIRGASGVDHQIDVYWRVKENGTLVEYLIQAKDRPGRNRVKLEHVLTLRAVVEDIQKKPDSSGQAKITRGIIVTSGKYQKGALSYAKANHVGIDIFCLYTPDIKKRERFVIDIKPEQIVSAQFPSLNVGIIMCQRGNDWVKMEFSDPARERSFRKLITNCIYQELGANLLPIGVSHIAEINMSLALISNDRTDPVSIQKIRCEIIIEMKKIQPGESLRIEYGDAVGWILQNMMDDNEIIVLNNFAIVK